MRCGLGTELGDTLGTPVCQAGALPLSYARASLLLHLIWRQGFTELSRLAVMVFCSPDRHPSASASLEAVTIGLGRETCMASVCIFCLAFSGLVAPVPRVCNLPLLGAYTQLNNCLCSEECE